MEISPLAQACMDGDLTFLHEDLLYRSEAWKDVDEGAILQTPLMMCAIDYGHTHIVKMLLEQGFDLNFRDRNDYTALHWAIFKGNAPIVEMLLQHGATVDQEALDLAQEHGVGDRIGQKLLIPHSADLYAHATDDDQILMQACRYGDLAKVKELILEKHYDYEKWRQEDGGYMALSPMHMAVKFGHVEIVQLFLEHGVSLPSTEGFAESYNPEKKTELAYFMIPSSNEDNEDHETEEDKHSPEDDVNPEER